MYKEQHLNCFQNDNWVENETGDILGERQVKSGKHSNKNSWPGKKKLPVLSYHYITRALLDVVGFSSNS